MWKTWQELVARLAPTYLSTSINIILRHCGVKDVYIGPHQKELYEEVQKLVDSGNVKVASSVITVLDSACSSLALHIAYFIERAVPIIKEIHEMITTTNIPLDYKVYKIPKSNGKVRVLHEPNEKLKQLQRLILRYLYTIAYYRNQYMHGFVPGRSIYTNASVHKGNDRFWKVDIKDAFPSTTPEHLEQYFKYGVEFFKKYCFVRYDGAYRLPQGAPTSPYLFNIVMSSVDAQMSTSAERLKVRYSRYADDITISYSSKDYPGGKPYYKPISVLERILKTAGYKINKDKIRFIKYDARITGVIAHANGSVTISRKKRRLYRAMLYNHITGKRKLTKHEINGIRGFLNMCGYTIKDGYKIVPKTT